MIVLIILIVVVSMLECRVQKFGDFMIFQLFFNL